MVEHEQLPIHTQGGGGDERFAGQHCGIGDQVACGWAVGAVKDKIIRCH